LKSIFVIKKKKLSLLTIQRLNKRIVITSAVQLDSVLNPPPGVFCCLPVTLKSKRSRANRDSRIDSS